MPPRFLHGEDYSEEHGKDFEALFNQEDAIDDGTEPDEEVQARGAGENWVPASIDTARVVSPYHIALETRGGCILAPEALLSALEACGIDNARIELEGGDEVPILDGSAMGWAVEVRAAGVRPSGPSGPAPVTWPTLRRPLTLHDGEEFIAFYPGDVMKITAGVEFEASAIGRQWHTWSSDLDPHFRYEVGPARRHFESVEAVTELMREGLMRGGADRVALVAQGHDWYDDSMLRFPVDASEAARHAIQTLLATISLAAEPGTRSLPLGHLVSYCAGLGLQLKFAHLLREELAAVAAAEAAARAGET